MSSKLLHTLPGGHPDRNRPLVGCLYRWKHAKSWREVKPTFGIARVTYNDLGDAWTANDVFCWPSDVSQGLADGSLRPREDSLTGCAQPCLST